MRKIYISNFRNTQSDIEDVLTALDIPECINTGGVSNLYMFDEKEWHFEKNSHFCSGTAIGSMGSSEWYTEAYLVSEENEVYSLRIGDNSSSNYAYESPIQTEGELLGDALKAFPQGKFLVTSEYSQSRWGQNSDHDWKVTLKIYYIPEDLDWDVKITTAE